MLRQSFSGRRPDNLSTLEALIFPYSLQEFFANAWQQQAALVRGPADQTLPIMEIDEFLLALFEAGLGAKEILYTHPDEPSREACLDAFFRVKAQWSRSPTLEQTSREIAGGTLVFDQLESRNKGAFQACSELFKATGCEITINGYLGAGAGASAFGAHWDDQDVFIVQLEGEKDWLLWDAMAEPGAADPTSLKPPAPPADQSVRLSRGSILYVPRGMWHWPQTVGDHPSFHLTVTLGVAQPKETLNWLESVLRQHPFPHKALPIVPWVPTDPSNEESLRQTIALLAAQLSSPDAPKHVATHLKMATLYNMHKRPKP